MKKETWTTKDGLTIPISELSDTHLINCISYIFRRAASDKENLICVNISTAMQLAEESKQPSDDRIILRDITESWAILVSDKMPALIKEAKKRNLAMPVYYTDRYITHTQYYGTDYVEDRYEDDCWSFSFDNDD